MVSKEEIDKVFTQVIIGSNLTVKCNEGGTKGSSGILGEVPRFEKSKPVPTNEELNHIADVMAERYGLEVSVNDKGKREIGQTKFSLWDDEHKTLIRLNKIVKHQEWIDFTNNGGGVYDLDEVLGYYNDLAPMQKDKMEAVLFETSRGASWNHIYDNKTDTINPIHISASVYYDRDGEFNMRQVIGHEAGHASERTFTREMADVIRKASVGVNTYNKLNLDTDHERQIYENVLHGTDGNSKDVSWSKEYIEARFNNKVFHASQYSRGYGAYNDQNTEDFAEVMSAVSFRHLQDKSGFHIRYGDGELRDWNTFVSDHQATYDLCCDYLDGKIKASDLHKPNGEDFDKWSEQYR